LLCGQRLGTFLIWQAITWAQQNHPDAIVIPFRPRSENDARHDKLYAGIGVPLSANSPPVKAASLVAPETRKKNIKEYALTEWLAGDLEGRMALARTDQAIARLREELKMTRKNWFMRLFG
jgi:hypothetical protein